MKLALMGEAGIANRSRLERHLASNWDIDEWAPNHGDGKARALLAGADAIICARAGKYRPGEILRLNSDTKNLKLVQLTSVGYDWLTPGMFPKGCVLANGTGHEAPMAEFALAALLEWEIKLSKYDAGLRQPKWPRGMGGEAPLETHGEVHGKTLGLLGFGNISRAIARRAHAFEMRVIGVARTPRDKTPAPLDWLGTMKDFGRLLAESDYLILACDLNDETRGLIDMNVFRKMKDSAVIMNLARGEVIEEKALYDALKEKVIAGGIIDTWYDYPMRPRPGGTLDMNPRPSIYPFHELGNIIMTPHFSALTEGADDRRWQNIARNLDLVARGERPTTAVMDGTREIGRPSKNG